MLRYSPKKSYGSKRFLGGRVRIDVAMSGKERCASKVTVLKTEEYGEDEEREEQNCGVDMRGR